MDERNLEKPAYQNRSTTRSGKNYKLEKQDALMMNREQLLKSKEHRHMFPPKTITSMHELDLSKSIQAAVDHTKVCSMR